ncbi:4-coumarate--CoA ligase-like 6 [Magnolia sinica]|uniref:4-coumarate--CoA ligase-like 6 n=1 Tax=Magnolia sinica TaxID=86752 RepID=UPI00265AB48F|nr:4-coumarate--CoA ligase-like 6 [Magnolia sinica]XP_058086352.1 4-coumarate--CoA ligase-like 6 [Magnolia sinica]XP_058086353.1 4-coumarate--CoA ligase-like 6 [Magnolia sinica]XP_058086354.1 4-coumarate--CoA ligase-like 6 [Magnolia sinica]
MSDTFISRHEYHSMESEASQMQDLSFPYENLAPCKPKTSTWFSSETGIYTSKHNPIKIPSDPFLDIVSFIFSHKHHGLSALVDSPSGHSISYTQLQELVKSMASGLHSIGISQGHVVSIQLPNTIYFPVIYLGVLSVGAIVTTMNPLSSFTEIQKQMADCNVVLAFTVSGCLEKLKRTGVRVVVIPESVESDSNSSEFSCFNGLLSSNPEFAPTPIIRQKDTAALLYSSGTSGVSKGVIITHANLIAAVELFVRFEVSLYENPGWENVYLAALPMFHVYGLSLFAMGLLSVGATVVVMRRFNADEMVRSIDRYRVTHIPVVPPIVTALMEAKGRCSHVFGSLKQVSCGAAPLSKKTIEEFLQSFPHVDFIQGYGMTESTAVGTRGFNTKMIRKYTSVGLLAPNMEAKVVDLNTRACLPPGKTGELWLRGPGIMKGYLNDAKATSSTIDEDGWLHTGDVVHFDLDGFLYVLDRLKEMIKYKGFQVAPADLEAILISHPGILDAAVIAAKVEEVGEIPVAFVVKKPGSVLSQADVIDYVSRLVSPHKKVRKVVFIHSIPRSAAGKILRKQLRNQGNARM